VIDVFPPRRGCARPARLTYLRDMDCENHQQALTSLLEAAAGECLYGSSRRIGT
jgi:hypothetical protein